MSRSLRLRKFDFNPTYSTSCPVHSGTIGPAPAWFMDQRVHIALLEIVNFLLHLQILGNPQSYRNENVQFFQYRETIPTDVDQIHRT